MLEVSFMNKLNFKKSNIYFKNLIKIYFILNKISEGTLVYV